MESEYNTKEEKVPTYTLPELMECLDGSSVTDQDVWEKKRRPEILKLFETHVYGKTPQEALNLKVVQLNQDDQALNGKALKKEIRVFFNGKGHEPFMDILLYLPNHQNEAHPLFLGLDFFGNHTTQDDPSITLSKKWMPEKDDFGIVDHRATEDSRGVRSGRWPVEKIIDRGYGLATIYCGDLDPDYHDGYSNGIHPLFYSEGQIQPQDHEWGTIGAWAWGLSRALDVLENEEGVDETKVAVMGHSRLGKTALWAAAQDERFAMSISNNSGCTGAALSRRRFGEKVSRINENFPHWFCNNYLHFNEKEEELPIDQHMLLSLIAPRPLYVASATEDLHADPRGEFLSCVHASPSYELFGLKGLGQNEDPEVEIPIQEGFIGYHLREGKHDVQSYDWEQFLNFADRHLKEKSKAS